MTRDERERIMAMREVIRELRAIRTEMRLARYPLWEDYIKDARRKSRKSKLS